MKVCVDENIPLQTVLALRDLGHDVRDIRGTDLEGMEDGDLWALVQHEKRLLISTDRGFRKYQNTPHFGVLLVLLRQPNSERIHQRVMMAVAQFSAEEWPDLLVVMRDTVQSTWRAPSETELAEDAGP